MTKVNGQLMSKEAFLKDAPYSKEPYEGIIVSADTRNDQYKIGIQLSENQVLLVDKVEDGAIQERLIHWIPRVNEIQTQYNVNNDLQNYADQ
ncbi:hypothetical protein Desor_2070 [Desulfosporosinus orientis DSM 765]|uniref:Uncharacterized protein n=1 Tax=Desulfosporosinus orientis (strain ATCC 19365 / DSM 765 / NCIMB 8382 / VKM B-1628 / Singapore I) TaxID=768706 RepID=G7WF67_DESOD|nr:hypothetical protein [Desulfosporosinus orientis]AET67678.1 hypothetical protein Desor_2070 [Desulfosporosinus orientis DSM 765]